MFGVLKTSQRMNKIILYDWKEDFKMADSKKRYPRTEDTQTVYLQNVITNPNIEVALIRCITTFIMTLRGKISFQ